MMPGTSSLTVGLPGKVVYDEEISVTGHSEEEDTEEQLGENGKSRCRYFFHLTMRETDF